MVGILQATTSDKKRRRLAFPPILFLGILFGFYTLIATFPSGQGFKRSSIAIAPILVVIAVEAINRSIPSRSVVFMFLVFIFSLFVFRSLESARSTIQSNNRIGEQLAPLREIVAKDARIQEYGDNIVIMTRNPWEVYYSTKYRAIQIPNEDLEVIVQVARRFGANYLLLPAPREALEALYAGESFDDRFRFVAEIPNSDLKLFRINAKD